MDDKERKDDEEITIDFSKIKNFFKSEKEEKSAEHKEEAKAAAHEKGDDVELSIDFSKIKNFFKSGEKESSGDDEIPVNWSRVIDFFKKYGIIFIVLIPIILSIYVRVQAGMLPITDQWAADTVINGIRSQIRAGIDQNNPNLPDANKNALVERELQKTISGNRKQIDDTIQAYSKSFKAFFQDENGNTYMPDIDPYYWVRYAQNIVKNGHPGDILKDGLPFDTYQLAPIGRPVFGDMFHSYFLAYLYKALHFFAPDLSLMRLAFYYPVFISSLSVLFVFLIARKIAGNTGGFFAGLIMAVNSAFLGRTLFGHADNDGWVVFFPLLVTWLFVSTIKARSTLKIVALSLLAGFFTGMYTFAWTGWWYIFDFLLATIGVTFLYLVLTNFNDVRKSPRFIFSDFALRGLIIFGVIYFISTAAFAALFTDFSSFRNSFLGPLSFPSIKAPVATTSIWPNVLTTVAELNEGSVNGIINSVGGPLFFFISLVGLALSISRAEGLRKFDFAYIIITGIFYGSYFIAKKIGIEVSVFGLLVWIMLPILLRIGISIYKKDSSYDFRLPILLSLWTASTIFASIKGIRFTLLLAPAFSVAFGVALGRIFSYVSSLLTKEFKIHKAIGSSILIVLLLLFYVNPIRGAASSAGSDIPIVNDAWYNTLAAIKQNSSETAIITSWWDFGHHFKLLADRRVTFDGTTQTRAPAHWVGRLTMTSDETEAMGILRMLDCGSGNGFFELEKIINDTHETFRVIRKIILLDKNNAGKKLKELKLNEKQIERVLSLTHCNPPEAYYIASEDMIGKSGVWSHFGSWNFERADIWKNARDMSQENAVDYMMSKFNYTKERAENIYFEMQAISSDSEANSWIAPWPGYGRNVGCSKNDNGIYTCSDGFQVNLSSYDIFAIGQQGIVRPRIAVFTTDNGVLRKEFNGSTVDFGVTIIPKGENDLEMVQSSKELAGSMFTRMFYMRGHGLKYFKLFNHQRGLTGTNIYTYKVDWEGKDTTIVEDFVRKPAAKEDVNNGTTEVSGTALDNFTIKNNTNIS